MDRKVAEEVMKELRKLDEIANRITALSQSMPTDQARSARRVIADAVSSAFTEIIRPIVKTFPDLHPDKNV